MASNLQAWEAYINEKITEAIRARVPTVIVDWGTITSQTAGWQTVYFHRVFPAAPGFVAVQGQGLGQPRGQSLSPPKIAAPTVAPPALSAPSLAALKINAPAAPISWGDQTKAVVSALCSSTIGQIPVIGGYLCSGIDDTFGALLAAMADELQKVYYLFDLQALLSNVAQGVEAKIATDWNANIDNLQAELTSWVGKEVNPALSDAANSVNAALADLAGVAQDAVNAIWPLIAEAMSLTGGEALPILKYRSVGTASAQVLAPGGGVQVTWIAVYGGS